MSYDLYLRDPVTRETLHTESTHEMRGGTYRIGGTTECHLNVTYNYGAILRQVLGEKGIRAIYGMGAAESIPVIDAAIGLLGNDVSIDYWEATEGNVKRALHALRALACLRPDGAWDGD